MEYIETIDLDEGIDILKAIRDLGLTPDEAIARLRKWDEPADVDDLSAMLETLD